MSKIALVTTPKSDRTTRYISAWAEKTIKKLESNQLHFIMLAKNRASISILESMLKKHRPVLLFLNGHGGSDLVCGHNNEILIQNGKNETVLKGTVTYALSCSSAKTLGPSAVQVGAVAYIGYNEDFIFFISPEKISRPIEDKTAEMFLAPANHAIVSLVKGHTAGEATNSSKSYFLKNIKKLVSSESSVDDREYARYLIWNMRSLVCLGNHEAVIV
ncbi:MAG: hypothetical protein AAB453_00665 [Patescibacteria group bacterium]